MGDTYSIASEAEANREHQKIHCIYIESTTIRGERGQYYQVFYEGAVLIDETWNPELEAYRALLARGITGRLEVWRVGKSCPDMLVRDIAKAAERTVVENESHGPRFVRWQPRPEDLLQNAVSCAAGIPPAVVLGLGATTLATKEIGPKLRPDGQSRQRCQTVKVMQ